MRIARVTVMTAAVIAALMQQPGLAMSKTFIVMRGPITKSKPGALVLDLKDLTYISSAGVRVVIAAQKTMKAARGGFAIVNLQPQIRKVFEIIMALPSPNVFESVADLDRYLAGIQRKMLGKDEA